MALAPCKLRLHHTSTRHGAARADRCFRPVAPCRAPARHNPVSGNPPAVNATSNPRALPVDREADVIVVGAGIAGLSCAVKLQQSGVRPLLLEASDGVGGRVRTDVVDGFLLDRGFQIFLTGAASVCILCIVLCIGTCLQVVCGR